MLVALSTAIKGKVQDPKDWATLNSSFQNYDVPAIEVARHIWRGYPLCPCHKHKRHWDEKRKKWGAFRDHRNWMPTGYLGLDFDSIGASFGELLLNDFVFQFSSFIHSTPSHTEENPRSRVIFELSEPIEDPDEYLQAMRALVWMFPNADQSCSDIVRLFFGSEKATVHLNRGENNELKILPLGVLRQKIREMEDDKKRKKLARREKAQRYLSQDPSEKERTAREALEYIDGYGIDYHDWFRIIAALTREFGASEAEAMVEAWAPGFDGEVARKIDTINLDHSSQAGLGTVVYIAKQFGYKPQRKEPVQAAQTAEELARQFYNVKYYGKP